MAGIALQEGEGEDPDTELLREQMRVMANELDQREAALEALQNSDTAENYEVELQVPNSPKRFRFRQMCPSNPLRYTPCCNLLQVLSKGAE
jgi:hypothetical protein